MTRLRMIAGATRRSIGGGWNSRNHCSRGTIRHNNVMARCHHWEIEYRCPDLTNSATSQRAGTVRLSTWWFLLGFVVWSSTAFVWVYVMQHLRFATLGAVYGVTSVLLLALVGLLFLGESLKWQEAVGSILLLGRFA